MRRSSPFTLSACCLWLSVSVLLSACGTTHRAPVDNRWAKINSSQRSYKVQAGDTIYSIAWRFGQSYQEFAAYNHLNAPYTVYPGQTLRLGAKPASKAAVLPKARPAKAAIVNAPETRVNPVAKKSAEEDTTVNKAPEPAAAKVTGQGSLPWPVQGKVICQFGQNGNKGIDIAVPMGTDVKAIDAGTVVYSGSNLHGYGQLVMIKHGNDLMTAYAHNSKLLVQEGSKVTRGQVIALSGDSDAARAMVHFELRQAGRPKNPLLFLT